MHLSNAISCLSTHDNSKGKTIENLDVSIHAIEELTGFNSLSVDKICQHTTKDHTMQLLTQHINDDSQTHPLNVLKIYVLISVLEMNSVFVMG